MDQLVCMRSFVRVADLHSFTKAADALGLSRAVVSTHVADLEKHLRCQLLQRTTRRVGLTADGSEYLARCQRILAELEVADEVMRRTRLAPQGRLRVDVPVEFGRALLIPALPKFTARYPELQLEVQFNDRVVDMIAEEIDLVVRVGAVREPHLVARRVVGTRLLTCASPEYLRTHGVPAVPDDLRRHKLVGYLPTGTRRAHRWLFQRGAQRLRFGLPFNIAFNSAEAEIRAAIRQMGEWRRQGLELDLAVNLSAPDILDPDLSDEILRLLRRYRQRVDALLGLPA